MAELFALNSGCSISPLWITGDQVDRAVMGESVLAAEDQADSDTVAALVRDVVAVEDWGWVADQVEDELRALPSLQTDDCPSGFTPFTG